MIRDFCSRIGVTKAEGVVEYELLEYCLRQDLNKRAERRMAVLHPLKVVIDNYPDDQVEELEATAPPSEPPLVLEDEGDRMRRILWEAVDELPEGYRLMILFKYRFGMKNAEIAEVMGITENNLRVKLYRAKNELRSAVRRKLQEGAE